MTREGAWGSANLLALLLTPNIIESRILMSVKFDLPDAALRKTVITRLIPSRAPIDRAILTDELLDKLASITEGFSYREMKNAVLLTLTECYVRDCAITGGLLEKVFSKKKKEIDDLKNKAGMDKKALGAKISENLKTGNYTVQQGSKDGADHRAVDTARKPMS